jgi:hypothetical protein
MSDTFVAVRGGSDPLPPVPSLDSLITPDALADLRELLLRHEARGTLIGISALRTLLLAELVDHIKTIDKDQKRFVDYVVPATSSSSTSQPVTPPPPGNPLGATTGTPGHPAAGAAARAPSRFVSEIANMLTPIVKIPVEQLHMTVDNQGKAIDKGAAGIAELHTARAVSEARLRALEANVLRLDAAHRGLSNRVAAMDIELGETEAATEILEEAVREAGEPVIVVVEEGENTDPGEPGRTPRARPMRQAGTNVRKAQARKKK